MGLYVCFFICNYRNPHNLDSKGSYFFDESNLVSNYFVLESIKSQPKIIAKAIREEKILFH